MWRAAGQCLPGSTSLSLASDLAGVRERERERECDLSGERERDCDLAVGVTQWRAARRGAPAAWG